MASSRASSLANDSAPSSPSELTPRSKVRAMLAALDDDSDGGSDHVPKKQDFSLKTGSHDMADADQERDASDSQNNVDTADDAEDEEDEVVFKPRGRHAARMLAVHSDMEDNAHHDGKADTARDRVKKLLAVEANQSAKVNLEEGHPGSSGGIEKSIVTRKRKIRRARESTPDPETSNGNDVSPGGMFVSPASHKSPRSARDAPSSEDDLPANPTANARFLALVEKKRQERIAREAEIHRQKAEKAGERARLSKTHSKLLEDDGVEYSDDDGGRKLTQQARPTRKASKRALEEMHRETQRMNRNMQLAHEARTKKKITKSDLFARFNYKPVGFVVEEVVEQARPTSSSSAPRTDTEMKDTPPTSPISHSSNGGKLADMVDPGGNPYTRDVNVSGIDSEEDIPSLKDALSRRIHSSPPTLASRPEKGKRRAVEEPEPLPTDLMVAQISESTLRSALPQVRPPKVALKAALLGNDSDSDLEIVPNKSPIRNGKESIFDRIPAKQARESHSLQALRMLANVTSPGKQLKGRNAKPSLTTSELQMSLQQRARQQAVREREERLQVLRDKGVVVQTAEEREREMADMEDLMAKARREGEEIMKREKDAAKRERKAKGEVDPLGDSSDDEDWEEEKEKFAEQMSGSGSDTDDNDPGDASNEEENDEDEDEGAISIDEEDSSLAISKPADPLIDNEASESDTAEEDAVMSGQDVEADFIDDGDEESDIALNHDDELPNIQARRRTKHLVISDDEDEEDLQIRSSVLPHTESPLPRNGESPKAPPSVLRSATKTFIPGLTVAGPAGLGLTQIFAGTMDDSQIQASEDSQSTQSQPLHELDTAQDSLAFLRNLPGPELPAFEQTMNEDSEDIVRDSQTQVTQVPESPLIGGVSQAIHLHFSQSQIHGFDSMPQNLSATQFSEFPEPTQDAGFQSISPIKGRFVEPPPSTIDTIILQQTPATDHVHESPVAKKKSRLRRRNETTIASDNEQEETSNEPAAEDADFEISKSIFDVMRKASKRKETDADDFDKKKSGAKEMVQEQAEESEDEYAGLGGASDDESGGEEDAYVKAMIDDEGGKDADERQLAAFYADKERANDEKQVEKLFKDITNGMLRRKRGADYDLSDSDDGGEARRRMRRTQEAKLRKALLEDERIGKIAENPKKMAFLRAIEDRGEDDEMDFLDDLEDAEETIDSQSQSQVDASQKEVLQVSDSQPNSIMGPPKRKLSQDSEIEKRLPPHLRRTKPAKRPSNLSEIRESLSSLIEEPNTIMMSHESSASDSEQENEDSASDARRTQKDKENRDPFASRRKDSIPVVDRISVKRASSNTVSTSTRLAFAAPSSTPGFKVPALLRRTTTNSSISSGSSTSGVSGTERMAGGFGDDAKFAKKAGKNSGVNYFARENERKRKVEESEKKRKEKRWKGAEGRRKVVGGLFGMGKFE